MLRDWNLHSDYQEKLRLKMLLHYEIIDLIITL